MFCIRCGAQVDDDAVFCMNCGEKVVRMGMPRQEMAGYIQNPNIQGTMPANDMNMTPPVTGTAQGYVQNGYVQGNQMQNGYSQGGYEQDVYAQGGQPQMGYEQEGYTQGGQPRRRQGQSEYSQRRPSQGNRPQGRQSEREFFQNEQSGQRRSQGRRIENGEKIKSGINSGEKGWRAYITPGNIERFAPAYLIALVPLKFITSIIESLAFEAYYTVPIAETVLGAVATIIKILTILLGVSASASLLYVAATQKNTDDAKKWIVPATVSAATVAQFLLYVIGGGNVKDPENVVLRVIVAILTLIIVLIPIAAFVVGLEFVARITIEGNPMESPINVEAALGTYKRLFEEAKAKATAEKKSDQEIENGTYDAEFSGISKFDGSGLQLLGYILLTALVSSITCTLALPWMICKIYRWKVEHTIINGKRLTFTGTGWSLFGHMILWELLTIITCGIYAGFMHVAIRKWELKYTFIEGEPVAVNVDVSRFTGSGWGYLGYLILSWLLCLITCSFAFPWTMSMMQKWDTSHQIINNRRLAFDGSGLGFLGQFLLILLLSTITCGLYLPWAIVRMNKYVIKHTRFC